MDKFLLCFVPLFVAVDAIGVLPLFVTLTEAMEAHRLRGVIVQSVATASVVALVFLFFGPALLGFLFARPITDRLGRTGTKTISKIASLLLASIAVMLVRRGILDIVATART